ncbi:phage repressor protein CI [Cronobacter sakazakii]|uniref:phage repressor protein CI n=1 Tax=Cronobacter sakazakii TaxID=28141 RepID=UPI000CF01F0B|nr:phage repressor protein CI [Cronobacter sakazakii]PPX83807.1 phage repressor protein CI [Cronobacter sakazakii]
MTKKNLIAQDVIDRISSAYGVSTQKALSEMLEIPPNNISSWVQRNSVPYKAVVECALDTGTDLNWLLTGEFAKSNQNHERGAVKGKALYEEIMASGGKPVLRRILDAYGFTMQRELGELLGISSGTISTWVRREFFPGDVVVTCSLDTGASLAWLATGKGDMWDSSAAGSMKPHAIKKYRLEAGELKESGEWLPDPTIASGNHESMLYVEGATTSWLIDGALSNIGNGRWLINIDGALDVFDVIRLPGGKVRLSNKAVEFECLLSEITPRGAVIFTLEKHL